MRTASASPPTASTSAAAAAACARKVCSAHAAPSMCSAPPAPRTYTGRGGDQRYLEGVRRGSGLYIWCAPPLVCAATPPRRARTPGGEGTT
eukprot:305774-Prorocentrum_minimum.AAC.1